MSHASPAGQLALAGLALQAWQRCTPKLVLSWPRFDGEVPLSASGLLTQAAGDEHGAAQQISVDRLLAALHASSGREPRPVARAVSWPVDRPLMGGTRALQLQSECPFRALAELRLGAAPVLDPMPGINPRERGQILHRSLELLWKDLVDSDSLRARGEDVGALETLARRVSAEAVRERLAGRAMALEAALAINEERRLSTLLMMLLQQELARAHLIEFTPIQLEQAQEYRVGGHAIRVRMDRLDRLPDGRTVVIDYKSGAAQSFRPLDERPRQAQLLVYALLAAHTAGAAAVHLNPDKIRWRGAAADQVLPDLPRPRAPTAPWPELMRHWRRVIDGLVHEFVAGVATVTPLPGACEHCHLAALCRVDAIALSAMDPDDERTGESHHER